MTKGRIQTLKPYLLMIFVQLGYTFLYLLAEASIKHGMNPHVYITYRHIVAGIVMLPFAFVLERNRRPVLTFRLFGEIFILSLLGVGFTLNMFALSLKLTSSTFVSAMVNTIAPLTFVIAVVLRIEGLDLHNPRGIAKLVGALISLSGVLTMAFYKGQTMKSVGEPLIHIQASISTVDQNWVKGAIVTVLSCVTWSLWYIMQAFTLKKYPAQLSLTTWMSLLGAAQSAIFTAIVEHNRAAWKLGLNFDLWSTLYGGIVVSGPVVYIQLWCTKAKGPVFVTMFNPLSTILVAIIAYFALGQKLFLGRIMGAAIVIIGLYLLLWGKAKTEKSDLSKEQLETNFNQEGNSSSIEIMVSENEIIHEGISVVIEEKR